MTIIEVRPFQVGQESILVKLYNAGFEEWMVNLEPCFGYHIVDETHVSQWVNQPSQSIRVAWCDGEPCGYASYRVATEHGKADFLFAQFELTHPDWGQSQIAVTPDYQRQGIATHIVSTVLDELAASGVSIVSAWTYNFNHPACEFLAHLGFIQQERFSFEPYSDIEPWGYNSVYSELDMKRPLKKMPLNPDLRLRAPQESDKPQFIELFSQSAPWAFGRHPRAADIDHWLKDPQRLGILVGEYNGEAVGVMEYFDNGILGLPGVLPDYRNRGFGTTLFYHLLDMMRNEGAPKAYGDTGLIQEDMLRMYTRFGFDLSRRLLNWNILL